MAEYLATIAWQRGEGDFASGKFSREHTWTFDGGAVVPASSAPGVVPPPYSSPSAVDPEEALVASLSSCHMLTFLFVCYKRGYVVESYTDNAVGVMTKNERGIPWVSQVTLHPRINFGGEKQPTAEELAALHHKAHEQCYIANTVKTEVIVATE